MDTYTGFSAWSPDGKKIAYQVLGFSGSGEIYIVNSNGTGKTKLLGGVFTVGDGLSWSQDGKKIVISICGPIYVINVDGKNKTRIADGHNPQWSPRVWSDVGVSDGITVTRLISFSLSSGWENKELFSPIYYRSPEALGKVVLGIGNKRDMWYLVTVYKRQAGQTWQEMAPWSFPYIAPWSEKTFLYTPQVGEEIKIEVWNDLNNKTLTALWKLDLITRTLFGTSISPQVTDPEEFVAKLLSFNDYLEVGGYLGVGRWEQGLWELDKALFLKAISDFAKTIEKYPEAQEALVYLLQRVGVKATTVTIASEVASIVTGIKFLIYAQKICKRILLWNSLLMNTGKEPFTEEVIFKAKEIIPSAAPNIRITKSLTIAQGEPYYVGETVNAKFTIMNKGTASITLNILTVGGRGPKGSGDVRDFTFKLNATLNPNESYNYEGGLKLLVNGSYHFFIAYQTVDGEWVTSVPTDTGITNTVDISVNSIPENWIGAELCSPGELRIYDSQGRVTGLVNGAERNEIPHSAYLENIVVILSPSDSYKYQVVGLSAGSYNLTTTNVIGGKATTFAATGISTSAKAVHQYTIDWDALSRGEKGVTIQIDSNGDGTFERSIAGSKEVTSAEFIPPTQELPFYIWIIAGVVAVSIVTVGVIITRSARRKTKNK